MLERNLQTRIRLAISESRMATMFTNPTGFDNHRNIHYGLTKKGSSDLIGWTTKPITPDMVGKDVAIFTAIEIKTKTGRVSNEQDNFLAAVRLAGGIAGVARSEEEAVEIVIDKTG